MYVCISFNKINKMRTGILVFFLLTILFVPLYAQNDSWGHKSHNDTIEYENVEYPAKTFFSLARQHKIKLDDGESFDDSVFFRSTWVAHDYYYDNYYFETAMMPGLEYQYYKPVRSDSVGSWSGISIEYLFYGKVHNDAQNGPGHVKFYGKIGILNSNISNTPVMFSGALGLTLSLEKDPRRTFFVPDFGLEAGAFSQKQLGTVFFFNPVAGIQFIALQNIFLGANVGYMYTMKNIELLRGYTVSASLDFSLWK